VHQAYRWLRQLPLRLDAQHWLADRCVDLALPLWCKGNLNDLDYQQPFALIKSCILMPGCVPRPTTPRG
jgi:hypothetical protein